MGEAWEVHYALISVFGPVMFLGLSLRWFQRFFLKVGDR